MATREVKWTTKSLLSCANCPPSSVVLQVDSSLVASKVCPGEDEDADFEYSTIEALLTKSCRTNSLVPSWSYTFQYDNSQLVEGAVLTPSDIQGAFCKGPFANWVEEVVGNEVHVEEDDGNFFLVSQHGCRYQISGVISEGSMKLEIVVPEDFGAIGDGAVDDTTAVQDAFNSGKTVFLNRGKTYLFSHLIIPSGLYLFGYGTLKRKNTSAIAAGESYAMDATDASSWVIEGIQLDGNRTNQSGDAGFKLSGLLVRGSSNFRIHGTTWREWHNDCIELTTVGQLNPISSDTPPADPSDVIRRGRITSNSFLDSGRNEDDGGGYSNSRALQVGSTCVDLVISDNLIRDCIGGIQCAAYNRHLAITGNTLFIDSGTYPYRSTGIAIEQLSTESVVSGNVVEGYREGILLESCLGIACVGNRIKGDIIGISCFNSSIGGTPTDLRRLAIVGNTVEINSTDSGTIGIKVTSVDFTHANDDNAISGNTVRGGEMGIRTKCMVRGAVVGNNVSGCKTGISSEVNVNTVISGNSVSDCDNEGIWCETGNDTVSVHGNRVSGCNKGIDVVGSQADLSIHDNVLLGNSVGVSPLDFRIQNPSTNNVRHFNNRFESSTGIQTTITASGESLKYRGDVYGINAAAYSTFVDHFPGQRVTFVAAQNGVTYTHNAAVAQKIFMKGGVNVTDNVNVGRTFISDGTHLYEC